MIIPLDGRICQQKLKTNNSNVWIKLEKQN